MQLVGPGRYRHASPEFVVTRTWTALVKALVSDFERVEFEAEFTLR